MNRALTSWGLIVGVTGMAVASFFGVFDQMLPVFRGAYAGTGLHEGFTIALVFSALSSDVVLMVLPILCAIPFTSAFLDDYKSRYIRAYLPRTGKKRYAGAKVIATAVSGGLTLFLGVAAVLIVFSVLFLPMEVPAEVPALTEYERQMQLMMEDAAQTDIASQQNFAQLMATAFVFFLCGCLWSLVGGLLATLTQSRYMAYASPFILYYVLVILSERYLKDIYVLNPREWLNPAADWVGGIWGAALFVGELIVVAGFGYSYVIGKKLEEA
jgi:hypothetical protein